MADGIKQYVSEYDFRDSFMITKSDTVNISADTGNVPGYAYANAVQVVTTGNFVAVVMNEQAPIAETLITVVGAPVGMILNCPIKRINSTNTTAVLVALIR